MGEKRMLIVEAELVKKIDENRGDMSQAEFINFLIDSQLKEDTKQKEYVTKGEFLSFEQDMKKLFRNFLDFFVGYGLELGKQSPKVEFEALNSKLQELGKDLDSDTEPGEAKIRWKD